jgi:hypothetical protein
MCLVILQPYGNRGVLVLRQDSWCDRPQSTYTLSGLNVLMLILKLHSNNNLLFLGKKSKLTCNMYAPL